MADNVTLNSMTGGAVVATDDVSSVHFQKVKLDGGGDGATQPIEGTTTNGLDVDVTRVQGTVIVDGSAVTQPVSHAALTELAAAIDTELQVDVVAALPAGTNNIGDVDVVSMKPDGTNTMPSGDALGRAIFVKPTDGTTVPDVSTAGADAQSNTSNRLNVAARINVFNGTTWDRMPGNTGGAFSQGNVAHGATDAGNPLKSGAKAIAHGTNPTAVSAGQRTDTYANRAGIPFFIGGHPNIVSLEYATTGAQTDTAIITVSAGTKIVVTQIQIVADNANTAFPQVRVGFGTANTPTTTGVVASHPGVPAGGGVNRGDGSGIIAIGADNEDLRITCGAPTGGSLRVLVSYYTVES